MRKCFPVATAIVLLLIAGCTRSTNSPSLAPRAVEREFTGAPAPTGPCAQDQDGCYKPAETEPVAPADDAAIGARVTELSAAAAEGQEAFAAILPAASAAAARAAEPGSDSWINAQQELSRLEAARGTTIDALSALDALAIDRADKPTSAADLDAITAAADAARRLSDAQEADLERLRGSLRQP